MTKKSKIHLEPVPLHSPDALKAAVAALIEQDGVQAGLEAIEKRDKAERPCSLILGYRDETHLYSLEIRSWPLPVVEEIDAMKAADIAGSGVGNPVIGRTPGPD